MVKILVVCLNENFHNDQLIYHKTNWNGSHKPILTSKTLLTVQKFWKIGKASGGDLFGPPQPLASEKVLIAVVRLATPPRNACLERFPLSLVCSTVKRSSAFVLLFDVSVDWMSVKKLGSRIGKKCCLMNLIPRHLLLQ